MGSGRSRRRSCQQVCAQSVNHHVIAPAPAQCCPSPCASPCGGGFGGYGGFGYGGW